MKKKLIIISAAIIVLVVTAVALVACNNATTQGQLANFLVDHRQEVFVYDVKNELTNETGTYTVTVTKCNSGSNIECPDTISNVPSGVLVASVLTVGTTEYRTGCYFAIVNGTSLMTPAYTYRIQSENGTENFRMTGTYDGSSFAYKKTVGSDTTDGNLKLSGTYFDNNEFHQSLRTVTTFSTSFNFSFAVPLVSPNETNLVNLTASCSSTANITTPYTDTLDGAEGGVECYKLSVSRSTKVAGISHTLFYAKNAMKASNSVFTMKNVLVKILEPIDGEYYMVYSLRSAEIF